MAKKKPEKDELEQLIVSYRETFRSASGKKVMEDMENRFFLKTTTFSENPNTMVFREGQRSVICHIKTMVEWDIEKLREFLAVMEKGQDMEPEL